MADKSKTARTVCQEELQLCIEEAKEALENTMDNRSITELRTL